AVRLLPGHRSASNLSALADGLAQIPARSQGADAIGRQAGRPPWLASSPRAAKYLQDFDQQLLWLSRFRTGALCRLRRRGAGHADRPRSIAEDDRVAQRARRAGY